MRTTLLTLASLAAAAAFAGRADAQILLNEVLYDAVGTDDGKTFIEIYGPPGFDISGFEIRSIEGDQLSTPALSCGNLNQTGLVTLPSGSIIGPDGLFVVADGIGGVTSVVVDPSHNGGQPDVIIDNADFENGPADEVQLVAGGGVIDALAYGTPTCTVDVTGQPVVFGNPAPDVFGGFSLERSPAGYAIYDNLSDFYVNGKPSPGRAGHPASLVFDIGAISATNGGAANLAITYANAPGRQYLVLGSITPPTGNDPLGVPFDPITNILLNLVATPNPITVNFIGNLDAQSKATATFTIPPGLLTLGSNVDFYFAALSAISAHGDTTNAAKITLTP